MVIAQCHGPAATKISSHGQAVSGRCRRPRAANCSDRTFSRQAHFHLLVLREAEGEGWHPLPAEAVELHRRLAEVEELPLEVEPLLQFEGSHNEEEALLHKEEEVLSEEEALRNEEEEELQAPVQQRVVVVEELPRLVAALAMSAVKEEAEGSQPASLARCTEPCLTWMISWMMWSTLHLPLPRSRQRPFQRSLLWQGLDPRLRLLRRKQNNSELSTEPCPTWTNSWTSLAPLPLRSLSLRPRRCRPHSRQERGPTAQVSRCATERYHSVNRKTLALSTARCQTSSTKKKRQPPLSRTLQLQERAAKIHSSRKGPSLQGHPAEAEAEQPHSTGTLTSSSKQAEGRDLPPAAAEVHRVVARSK